MHIHIITEHKLNLY